MLLLDLVYHHFQCLADLGDGLPGRADLVLLSAAPPNLLIITTDEIHIESIREGIDLTATARMSNLIKPVNYLSNIGSVSPLVGLLGTVSGMIKAFQSLSLGASANAEQMANNISEALITTAAGLIIAIPAMLFYFWFKNNFMETLSIINSEIGRLLNALQTGATRYTPATEPEAEA